MLEQAPIAGLGEATLPRPLPLGVWTAGWNNSVQSLITTGLSRVTDTRLRTSMSKATICPGQPGEAPEPNHDANCRRRSKTMPFASNRPQIRALPTRTWWGSAERLVVVSEGPSALGPEPWFLDTGIQHRESPRPVRSSRCQDPRGGFGARLRAESRARGGDEHGSIGAKVACPSLSAAQRLAVRRIGLELVRSFDLLARRVNARRMKSAERLAAGGGHARSLGEVTT